MARLERQRAPRTMRVNVGGFEVDWDPEMPWEPEFVLDDCMIDHWRGPMDDYGQLYIGPDPRFDYSDSEDGWGDENGEEEGDGVDGEDGDDDGESQDGDEAGDSGTEEGAEDEAEEQEEEQDETDGDGEEDEPEPVQGIRLRGGKVLAASA
ncbi:hypothetical protein DFJ74DRAFT_694204 [Hyaloraphidium curvatum]|nr:hypothetical protein DFJ74DRAFT_694204 [Hyaloraphidium curvatum]